MEIGFNGGITPFVTVGNEYLRNKAKESMPQKYISAKFSFHADKGWWIGFGVDAYSITFSVTDGVNYMNMSITSRYTYNTIAPYLFLNKYIKSGNNTIYAGASAGLCPGWYKSKYTNTISNNPYSYSTGDDIANRPTTYNGVYIGIQAGYIYNVTKHLGINAEAGAKFVSMSGTNTSILTLPVSAGIRYRR
jgi:hypothetical protein